MFFIDMVVVDMFVADIFVVDMVVVVVVVVKFVVDMVNVAGQTTKRAPPSSVPVGQNLRAKTNSNSTGFR